MAVVVRRVRVGDHQPLTDLLRRNADVEVPILPDEWRQQLIAGGQLHEKLPRQILYGAYRDRYNLVGAAVVARLLNGELEWLETAGRNPLEWLGQAWHICWMAVEESWRGQGMARLMTEKIIDDARKEKISRVDGVADGPAYLDAVYRGLGFEVTEQPDSPWMLALREQLRRQGVKAVTARPNARYFFREL